MFQCPVCRLRFPDEIEASAHLRDAHAGVYVPLHCPLCWRALGSDYVLAAEHLLVEHYAFMRPRKLLVVHDAVGLV